jgi:2,4-dienoyl-CoA reductase-like NADH-dependent reductase (Old Yellow Enzyme family)/thioredoxin reductase
MIMTGMSAHMAPDAGYATDREIAFYERRAAGGVGYIIVGAAFVHPSGTFGAQLGLHDDRMIPGQARLAEAIRRHGAVASIQLHHAGRQTTTAVTGQKVLLAPSAIACPIKREIPRAMNVDDIDEAIGWYADGARRAMAAGYNGIEIHGAHGYLPAQFLSPRSNARSDEYGGTLENRARFLLQLVAAVRNVVGAAVPLSVKISGDEYSDGGLTRDDTPRIARLLETAGVDLITISAGAAPYYHTVPNMALPRGCFVDVAHQVRQTCSVPVSAVGRINTLEHAESILAKGQADFISLGRALIADPDFPNKAKTGDAENLCICVGCNKGCHDPGRAERATACLLNAEAGFERELAIVPAQHVKRVLVIGGGPGGLEAARVAAARGHQTVLCEKNAYWGGNLYLGTLPPDKAEYAVGIDYLVRQCERHGVDMRLNCELTTDALTELLPDTVIVATGAVPVEPAIEGIVDGTGKQDSHPVVITAEALLADGIPDGKQMIVIGGGAVGTEVAHLLARQDVQVTIMEMGSDWGQGMPPDARWHIEQDFKRLGVNVELHTRVTAVDGDTVHCQTDEGEFVGFDSIDAIVLAIGARPQATLVKELRAQFAEVSIIGDAVQPRSALEAVAEGYRAAIAV